MFNKVQTQGNRVLESDPIIYVNSNKKYMQLIFTLSNCIS